MYPRISVLIAASLLASLGCSKKEEKEAEAPAPVQVTAVTQDTIRRMVEADGVLYPQDQASVMPKISAPVQKFYVNRGDHVKAGQPLAVLENRDLKAAAANNKAQLDQAQANYRGVATATVPEAVVKAQTDVQAAKEQLDAAQKVLESRQQLFKEGALARKMVDDQQVVFAQAKAQFEAAQEHLRALQSVGKEEQIKTAAAQVESAQAQLLAADTQVGYSEIRSPISGVIADRPIYAGEMASAGTPLVTVMDISRVVARVNVPQAQSSTVKLGQAATITQTDSGQQSQGKVIVVSPATDPSSTTVQVWVQADNPGERLKPGASVHAAIVTETIRNATIVPASAILPGEEKGSAVLTVTPDSTAHLRPVEVGVRLGNRVQILSGVKPGDEVVVSGGLGVEDKAKVRRLEAGAPEEADEDEDAGPAPADAKGAKDGKQGEAKPKAK